MEVDIEVLKQWLRDKNEDELQKGRLAAEQVKCRSGQGQPHSVDTDLRDSRMAAARAYAYKNVLYHLLETEQEQ